ncbi:ribonuclease H-like domain-containing protein, partial [Tanacetum coccineum]
MSIHNFENGDDYVEDNVTLISKLDISDPLHLHPNDTTALTVVLIKLKGTENYQVWSCAMLLALKGKNKIGFIDGTCKRSNTYEVLRKQWDRYDAMIEFPKCVCNASEGFKRHNQLLKLMQFLMGLDDSYMEIRSSILSKEVLPDVRSAYATISCEESHRVATGSIAGSSQRNQASAFVSNIIEYPADFGKKKSSRNFKNKNVSNNNSDGKSSSSGFTDEQINGKIVDSWANQHMTYTDKELDNVLDISHLKIKVGHPNGTEAYISKIGNLKLSNGLTLYDVMVIPEYCVTLNSVHKLAKENKVIFAFDENRCYFLNHDLNLKNVLGIGDQCEGLLGHPSEPVLNVLKYSLQFDIDNPKNDADSSDEFVATQNEEVAILEENIFSKVKYGLEKYIGYSKLKSEDYYFVTQLNKTREPKSYFEASKYPHGTDAMNQEMNALLRNGTWEIIKLPKDRKAIESKRKGLIMRRLFLLLLRWLLLDEIVYMKPPEGYFPSDNKVCRLKKSLYGLKRAPRQWNAKLTSTFIENSFSQSKSGYSLYTNVSKIEKFKVFLKTKFMIKDFGKLKYFLGIEVVDTEKGICLNQRKYVLDLLSEYDPLLKNVTDYQKLIGKLIYLTNTKPNISYDVHCLSQFMHSPLTSHLKIGFKILRYLQSCPGLDIHIVKSSGIFLNAYSDVDWANNSAIKIAANPVFHERTKHLEIDLHFVREIFLKDVVKTMKVESENQIADILTKGLDTVQHIDLVKRLVIALKKALGLRFEEFETVFNQGKTNRGEGIRGENKKGISDIYKEFHKVEDEDSVIFRFGSKNEEASKNNRCEINMEHVKEVGELIGVSWALTEKEKEKRGIEREGRHERTLLLSSPNKSCGVVDDLWIEDIWGGKSYGYSQLPANGNSRGITLIWDTRVLRCMEAVGDKRFVAIKGSWNGKVGNVFLISGSSNGGRRFTRVSDDGLKFSKLDCFLLNEEFGNLWGNLSIIALDRKLSDHCPIVLKDMDLDYGSKPFRVFNIWIEELDFQYVVEEAWKKEVRNTRPDCRFRDRLKNVKESLRVWSNDRFGEHKGKIEMLKNEAMGWELEAEKRTLSEVERVTWLETRKQWEGKENEYGNNFRQKARIRWDVEGDENSKFFHSVFRPIFCCNRVDKISVEEARDLEKEFNEKE